MMNNKMMTPHITAEDIAEYFEGIMPEDREGLIEEHLADCDACTHQARQWHAFSEVWNTWTAQAHGETYRQARLRAGLTQMQEEEADQTVKDRLAQWRTHWAGLAEAAVRVIFDAQKKAAHVVTEGLDAMVRPGGVWQFAPATASGLTLGPRRSWGTEAAPTVALAPGTPQAKVAVSGAIKEVSVRVDGWPRGQRSPLVVLIPMKEGGEPKVKELKRSTDAKYLIARFERVEPGDYLVAFEPLERASE